MAAGMMTSGSNSGERYRTSAANSAPASGARKMAAMPAPMPAAIRMRRSATLSRRRFARSEPKPAPICAIGPSRPPEPPVPMRHGAGDDLDQRHPRPDLPLLAMIGVDHAIGSVPFRLGGKVKTSRPLSRPPTVGTISSSQGRNVVPQTGSHASSASPAG